VCGHRAAGGAKAGPDGCPRPIFTPATKEDSGHDINISFNDMVARVGQGPAAELMERSIAIYRWGAEYALSRGIILADTKFEWGPAAGRLAHPDRRGADAGQLALLAGRQLEGRRANPPSFDKQFVRDWLETSGWDKNSPPPELPADVVGRTRDKYLEAYQRLTGHPLRD